ncbi:plasmid replication protein RepC [Paracoccus jiaweipingae]|uniref:plasmid replication protein RepC n=1 Tax=unclassified Paracoccus (in: a-proteobacteria) TaxID=2688777 RepID=UPI0037AD594C
MRHISMTPFGRQPVTAGLLATQALAEAPAPDTTPDKWAVLRDLTTARAVWGVSDRDLVVLSALLSFHPARDLADDDRLIVFPSNAALSDRAHGMAESTLRRHLSALVRAGLILRRDSPNGKRYATRDISGALDRVFGFDLRPLLVQAPRIAAQADHARAQALALRRQREGVVIRLRDAAKLLAWAQDHSPAPLDRLTTALAGLQRALRRKPEAQALRELDAAAVDLHRAITQVLPKETSEMDGNDVENGRHYQNSNPDTFESEPCPDGQKHPAAAPPLPPAPAPDEPPIPLGLVLKATPEIRDYAPDGIRNWQDLLRTADFLRPMLGISSDAWRRAVTSMGKANAAITLACILQRAGQIMRPGGYLRALTDKAEAGAFSPAPMVMALIRADNSRTI